MSKELELLQELKASFDKKNDELSKTAEEALKTAQESGQLSADAKEKADKLLSETNQLKQDINKLEVQLGEAEKAFANIPTQGDAQIQQTAGQIVAKFEALKDFAGRILANERSRISIPMPRSALITTDLADGVIETDRLPSILQQPKQRLFIRDLITPGRTGSNNISYVRQTGFANNAAAVLENTRKPESNIVFDVVDTSVKTIAHIFKASKQVLDDFAQLQSIIDAELRFGLKFAEEQEILFGNGTGVHLLGIVPQATNYTAPGGADAATTSIDVIRLAMLQAQLARIPASGIVLHYTDWANIELKKDTLGRYIIGNPQGTTAPSLWGLPIVPTEIPAFLGKFLTGGFAGGAQIFDREDANVVIATENEDDFVKNMITIRCEERLALAVYRPEAFIYGSVTVKP